MGDYGISSHLVYRAFPTQRHLVKFSGGEMNQSSIRTLTRSYLTTCEYVVIQGSNMHQNRYVIRKQVHKEISI